MPIFKSDDERKSLPSNIHAPLEVEFLHGYRPVRCRLGGSSASPEKARLPLASTTRNLTASMSFIAYGFLLKVTSIVNDAA